MKNDWIIEQKHEHGSEFRVALDPTDDGAMLCLREDENGECMEMLIIKLDIRELILLKATIEAILDDLNEDTEHNGVSLW